MLTVEQRLEVLETKVGLLERGEKYEPEVLKPVSKHWTGPIQPKPTGRPETKQKTTADNASGSGQLLGLIGALCFIFAAVYIVKLALDSGWLTPMKQVMMAATLGFALIGAGFALTTSDKEYSSYLPATGIVILYLTVFGATTFYHVMSFEAACVASVLISIGCLRLYKNFQFEVYQFIAGVGAYVMPFFLGNEANLMFTNVYYIIVSITFTIMSIRLDLRPVSLVSAYLAIFVTSVLNVPADQLELKLYFILAHFMIYASGVLIHTIYNKRPLTNSEALGFFPVILFFYAVEYYYLDRLYPEQAPLFSLALSFALIAFYFVGKKKLDSNTPLASGNMIFSAVLVMLTHSLYFVLLPESLRPVVFIGLCGALFLLNNRVPESWNLLNTLVRIFVAVLLIWNIFTIVAGQFSSSSQINIFNGAVYAILLLLLAVNAKKFDAVAINANLALALAHPIAILSLFNLVKSGGSLNVSVAWTLYALAILGIGYAKKDRLFAKSSVIVLLIAALKVLIYDTSSAAMGVRVICLLLTGTVLYFSGFIFRKVDSWKTT